MRHGESFSSTGERIVVAVDVVGGRFASVPGFTGLVDAPADLGVPAMAARIRAGIPFNNANPRTAPWDVACAVRQAVADIPVVDRIGSYTPSEIDRLTADWSRLAWRILPEQSRSPSVNLALDEVLTDRVARRLRPPTLRFWGWNAAAVILGRTQSVLNEVDLDAASAAEVSVVRRISGGGAMFVQPCGAVTYSLILPESAVDGLTIRQSYEVCDAWVVRALRGMGYEAHHVPVNDLAWAGGKFGGAAQARRQGVVLHHTTLACNLDANEMAAVLRLGRDRRRSRGTASASKWVSPLAEQLPMPREAIVTALGHEFRSRYGGDTDEPTDEELAAAEHLAIEKYDTTEWTNAFE